MLDADLTLLIRKGGEDNVTLEAELPGSLRAPVEKGDPAGWVYVRQSGTTVACVPVVAAEDVGLRSLGDGVSHVFEKWCFQ